MRTKTMLIAVAVIALLILTVGIAGALQNRASGPDGGGGGTRISYQGRLTGPSGAPLDGSYTMRFQLYDAVSGGTMLWDSTPLTVAVSRGVFNVPLAATQSLFDGRSLWVALTVNGELLSPRQEVLATAYALSILPGAHIIGPPDVATGAALHVEMTGYWPSAAAIRAEVPSTGSAVYATSIQGTGVYGYSRDTYGVWGNSQNSYGGYFSSQGGNGIVATTSGTAHYDHGGVFSAVSGNGVLARSTQNTAIRGEAGSLTGTSQPGGHTGVLGLGEARGVWGSSGAGEGVYGASNTGSGVYGRTNSIDETTTAGVVGERAGGEGSGMLALRSGSAGGYGILAINSGTTGSGASGESTNYMGVWGQTDSAGHNYGLYTPDNLFSANYHLAGAIMQVVQNSGATAVEPGDVLAFAGVAAPVREGAAPTIQVERVSAANSTAVAGVVYSRFNIQAIDGSWKSNGAGTETEARVTLPGPVPTGEYLLMVVQGPAQVKVDAEAGAIRPGDLLSSAAAAGRAARAKMVALDGASLALPGTVFAKALEPVTAGQKSIYVYVTLQ